MTYAFKGMMVLYRLTAEQALATNKRRADANKNRPKMREERPGFQAHIGNMVEVRTTVPMVVTQVWDQTKNGMSAINGQAFLDGSDSLWLDTILEGDGPGQWEPILHG